MKNIFNFDKTICRFHRVYGIKKSDTLNDLATFSDKFNNTVVDCHSKHNCILKYH